MCNFSVLEPELAAGRDLEHRRNRRVSGSPASSHAADIGAGSGDTFSIQITPPCGTGLVTGTLIVNTNIYALTGSGVDPPLPKPVLALDSSSYLRAGSSTR